MSVHVNITDGPLPTSTFHHTQDSLGATVCFEGIVRPLEGSDAIVGLQYRTYDPMAAQELRRLGEQAVERFGVLSILVDHSRGFVPVHGCSFRLHMAAVHRKELLMAMEWFIGQMKKNVPIWKSPVFDARVKASTHN